MIYFDNAASMKPRQEAIDVFTEVAANNFSNPAALHKGGIEAEKVITNARETLLSSLPKGGNLLFTSGATESNNLAGLNSVKPRKKTKIVTTTIEHPSVSNVVDKLCESSDLYSVVRVFPDEIVDAVCENTCFVSMISVCGETGFIVDTKKIYGDIKRKFPDCIVHVDGVQGFLKTNLDGDLISISSHKIGGLPGVGGLYIKNKTRLTPMFFGGGQQALSKERISLRPGTEPTALIAAFARAATAERCNSQLLHDRLIAGLTSFRVNSYNNVFDIVNFSCGVKSEIMLHFLAENGIYVSSGSACARGKKSQILPAYKISDDDVDTAIRVSFGWHNTVEEVDKFLNVLEEGVKRWK